MLDDAETAEAREEWRQAVELRRLFGQICDGRSSSAIGRALSLMITDAIWQNSDNYTDTRQGLAAFVRDAERAIAGKTTSGHRKIQ